MFNELKTYINNRIKLTKLDILDSVSHMLASGIYALILGVFFLFLLLLGSLALGFILGSYFDDVGLGFLAITGVHLLVMVLAILFRKRIKLMLVNFAIDNAMEAISKEEEDDEH